VDSAVYPINSLDFETFNSAIPKFPGQKAYRTAIPSQPLMCYHPDFNGSFSIKSVLPAMFPDDAALDYKGLDIQAGDMVSMIYADPDRIDDESER